MSRPDSSDDLESIEETLAILSDPLAMEQVRESEQAIEAGERGTSHADVQARLERRQRAAEA
jgi:PHD/YefM family antitoxin component YafN of YafNO toxin-antitoxin module